MISAFGDDVYHLQETFKNLQGTKALLKRLRFKGYQCAAAPAVIKESRLSCGVLTAIKKSKSGQLPSSNKEGITDDPRVIWSRIRIEGITKPILMANCYLHSGDGLKDRNLHYLRKLSIASDGGKQPVFAFCDFNIPAEVLRTSGILEALGLELVTPAQGSHTCTAGRGTSLITSYALRAGANSSSPVRSCIQPRAALTSGCGPRSSPMPPTS